MVTIIRNTGLDDAATSGQTSTVCEPTVAAAGRQVFFTGNWFASRSGTSGASWTHVNPFTAFAAASGGFCCDQVALYDPSRKIWIWILQYSAAGGSNIFRIAVAKSSNGPWKYWGFAPAQLSPAYSNLWFDYPDAALSANHLFVTFNVFNAADAWQRAVVFKFPLAQLAEGLGLTYDWWTTTGHGSLRLTQGASTEMNLGAHNGSRTLRVWRWPDGPGNVTFFDVTTAAWSAGPYAAGGPGGNNWLARIDSRITGGWRRGREAGFLWTASPSGGKPRPYIKAAVVDTTSGTLTGQPDIWSNTGTWAYPAAAVSSASAVGFTAFYGSGQRHPAHVVGARRQDGTWDSALTATSTHGPADRKWGDYLSIRPHPARAGSWAASGYTLQGGAERQHIEPRYVHFTA